MSAGALETWAPTSGVGVQGVRLRAVGGPLTRNDRGRGIAGRLNAEFDRLRDAPGTAEAVGRWAARVPALAECHDLVDVELVVSGHQADAALRGLIGQAQAGDTLAARVVLQASLGSVLGLARRTVHHAGGDVDEAEAAALTRLWELIGSYRLSRRCAVHDGLALEVLRTLTGRGDRSPPADAQGSAEDVVQLTTQAVAPPDIADPLHPVGRADEDVLRLLTWAVRRGTLSRADAALLWHIHSPDDAAAARSSAARDRRVSEATVRQRACRARARLLAAVQEATAG